MKIIYKILLVLIFITLNSCSKEKQKTKIIEINQELEMVSTYREGMEEIEKNDYYIAAKKFLESELLFPQSKWAPKSALMASYSYYMQDYYSEAIFNLERYLSSYPNDKNISYAHFLIAMCYYENIEDEKKDLGPLLKAKNKFNYILTEYPNTDFALDSSLKIDLINDILASKEMYIGRHYIKREKWIAAINRFKTVIEDYETTVYVQEAIHRLVEIYYHIGFLEESKKYANLLGYNYLSSEWYKKSYKLFNKNYKEAKVKKNKKGIIKKFKKLFD